MLVKSSDPHNDLEEVGHGKSEDRELYKKQMGLCNTEGDSRFNHYPILKDGAQSSEQGVETKDRFQLLNMIGKGGFSEIYKAFDLDQMCCLAEALKNRTWIYIYVCVCYIQ